MTPDVTQPCRLAAMDVAAMDGKLSELSMLARGMLDVPGLKPAESKCWRKVLDTCDECRRITAHAQTPNYGQPLTPERIAELGEQWGKKWSNTP